MSASKVVVTSPKNATRDSRHMVRDKKKCMYVCICFIIIVFSPTSVRAHIICFLVILRLTVTMAVSHTLRSESYIEVRL